MNITIAGYGFVGKAVYNSLKEKNTINIVDPLYGDHCVSDFPDSEGVIICVGTPKGNNGDCDISQIQAVMSTIPEGIPVLIKCTAPPDYLKSIIAQYPKNSICYSPEFLRAVSADRDFYEQNYMVIGGEDPGELWQRLFAKSLPFCRRYIYTTVTEASMVKYSTNCFLSVKLAFLNQIYDLCQANGADYDTVSNILSFDPRIGNSHMQVPGSDGRRGFGGACFPKDTAAFVHYGKRLNLPVTVVATAVDYNDQLTKGI
jgi:UDPglucose 6-dehydrogenase